jgi:hypothetical protein
VKTVVVVAVLLSSSTFALCQNQSSRDELAKLLNETGQGVVVSQATGTILTSVSPAFCQTTNQDAWIKTLGLEPDLWSKKKGNYRDRVGNMCQRGFQMAIVACTKKVYRTVRINCPE